jgi:hypothetical protein
MFNYAGFVPNKTAREILEESKRAREAAATTQQQKKTTSTGNKEDNRTAPIPKVDWQAFEDISKDVFRERMAKLTGRLVPVQPIARIYYPKQAAVWAQAPTRCKMDQSITELLRQPQYSRFKEFVSTHVRSNGTFEGLHVRMEAKLCHPRTDISVATHRHLVPAVLKHLPILVPTTPDEVVFDIDTFKLNEKSSVGYPYFMEANMNNLHEFKMGCLTTLNPKMFEQPDKPILKEHTTILEHAIYIANYLASGLGGCPKIEVALQQWASIQEQVPWINTFLLKRKEEIGPRAEILTKARPYGVQPLPARLMSMIAVRALDRRMQNFEENPDSISAYKFCPFFGGAERLVKHFGKRLASHNCVCVAYGDDALWGFKFDNGKVVILGPDVASMDMSTTNHHAVRVLDWLFSDKTIKKYHKNLLAVWATLAFNHQLAIGGPFVMAKSNSLISGVPGTTQLNIVNSAYIWAIVEEEFLKDRREEQFKYVLERAMDKILKILNFKFKPLDDTNREAFTSLDDFLAKGTRVPFLQTSFKRHEKGLVVALPSDTTKLIGPLAMPPNGPITNQRRAAVGLGVHYVGGWSDPLLTAITKPLVELGVASGFDLKAELELAVFGEEEVREEVGFVSKSKVLPTPEQMYDFNTMDKESYVRKWRNPLSIGAVAPTSNTGIIGGLFDSASDDDDTEETPAASAKATTSTTTTTTTVSGASLVASAFREDDENEDESAPQPQTTPASSSSSTSGVLKSYSMAAAGSAAGAAAAAAAAPADSEPESEQNRIVAPSAFDKHSITTSIPLPTPPVATVLPTTAAMGNVGALTIKGKLAKLKKAQEKWKLREMKKLHARMVAKETAIGYGKGKRYGKLQPTDTDEIEELYDQEYEQQLLDEEEMDEYETYNTNRKIQKQILDFERKARSGSQFPAWADIDDDEDLARDTVTTFYESAGLSEYKPWDRYEAMESQIGDLKM